MAIPSVGITIYLSDEDIERMKEKFDIQSNDDIRRAVYECIETYLEM